MEWTLVLYSGLHSGVFSSRVNLLTPRFSEIEKGFSQYIMKLWTDFAKFGSPTPPGSNTSPITWRPFTEEEQFYLALDVKPRLKQHYRASQVTFWNNFIPEVTRKGKKGKITKKP
ncbi:Cocaine esterase [Desmophyllum pertusum]|uniref:Cocaine esterase n=1 Tax=Desmophyllum pertusum TaxID=174260 RepID=A0A9X0A465_9CNID|nr:Cocaine esterase [Desmophyllum pertusum]